MASERLDRQRGVADWCRATFGERGSSLSVRAARFLEEALEAYQAAGADAAVAHRLVDHVFGRPVGFLRKEIGQCGVSLLAFAAAAGTDADQEEQIEIARLALISGETMRARYAERCAAGIGSGSQDAENV